jgi:hypothetical protein
MRGERHWLGPEALVPPEGLGPEELDAAGDGSLLLLPVEAAVLLRAAGWEVTGLPAAGRGCATGCLLCASRWRSASSRCLSAACGPECLGEV